MTANKKAEIAKPPSEIIIETLDDFVSRIFPEIDMEHSYTFVNEKLPNGTDILFIHPSIWDGYYFITIYHFSPGQRYAEGLSKAFKKELIPEIITFLHFHFNKARVHIDPCKRISYNDYIKKPTSTSNKKKTPLEVYEEFDKDSKVYFIQSIKGGPIKIGLSKNISSRIELFQKHNPHKLNILTFIKGGRKKEAELHKKFAKYRLHNEWFEASPEILVFIEKMNKNKEDLETP